MRALLQSRGLPGFLLAQVLARSADTALVVLLGIAVYRAAGTPLALGWLGLAQAVPAIGLVLLGGHAADRARRRDLAVACTVALGALAAVLAAAHALAPRPALGTLYGVGFLLGVVNAFAAPALSGLEAQVVPQHLAVQGASLVSSVTRVAVLGAPVAAGFAYDGIGPVPTYAALAGLLAVAAVCLATLVPAAAPAGGARPPMLAHIVEGVRHVLADQVLIGSMALDLFAVFFGGAAALFPVFAERLGLGAAGVGMMRGAASAGALVSMALAVRHPPRRHAGLWLHLSIAGFGVGIIVFGLSEHVWLSLAALAFVGLCDGVNVVIRRAIVRLASPEAMRGRIAAVRMMFVNSANELGDFESGMAAAALGAVPAVWGGGAVMLGVVALTAWRLPRLRALDLNTLRPR